ncbi:DMT family transporter [Celerinatantimonas yamalensis]|uniref:DMT family transporter n=1 Tax=Celerinatantimonas yamalensis TaxID=559956 RepID=A0ABW9GCV7_9GAMM
MSSLPTSRILSSSQPQNLLNRPSSRLLLAIIATLLWGSAFPMVKLGYVNLGIEHSQTFTQILFAGYRFSGAGLFLLLLSSLVHRQTWRFSADKLLRVVKVGSCQTFLQYIFFYLGLALASGISSAIVASAAPFFQLIIAHVLFADDKLSARKAISAIIGFCGIGFYQVMEYGWALHLGVGEALMLIAMLFSAYGNVLSKRNIRPGLPVLTLTAWQMLLGGAALTGVGAIKVGLMPWVWSALSLILLTYLSALSACAFLIWNTLMAHNRVSQISVFLFLIPIFGVSLSAIILGEALHWYVLRRRHRLSSSQQNVTITPIQQWIVKISIRDNGMTKTDKYVYTAL